MSDVNYKLVDFEGSLQNSSNIEANIDELASSISTFRSSLDPRVNQYFSDLDRLDSCKNDLSNDVTNVNNFHNWLQEGYNDYEETAHQTEVIANGAGSPGGSGSGSGGGYGVSSGGLSNIATELSPFSSDRTANAIGTISGGVSDTISSSGSSTSSTSNGLGSFGSGAQNSSGNNASAIAAGAGAAAAAGAGALGAGALGTGALGTGSSTITTTGSSSSSNGSLSGQTYNGDVARSNSAAMGELNQILGDSDEKDDEDDDKKDPGDLIGNDISKEAKNKVDKIISKTKKVIPKLHSSEVGDSSGTGTSAGGIAAAGLGGLGVIGTISGGIAYANNKLNTDDEDEDDDEDDDDELGNYDDKENDEKNGSNGDGQISNKDWLYGLGIGLGAAGMAKKIKDDKDDEENENSNQ